MPRVVIQQSPSIPPLKRLAEIPNGTFFTGTINGFVSAGPFLKVGSITCNVWFVLKLERPDGGNYCSLRADDRDAVVADYRQLLVAEIVLRDRCDEANQASPGRDSIPANEKDG